MASPLDKLAEFLEVLRGLQASGVVAIRSGELRRRILSAERDRRTSGAGYGARCI